MDIVDGVGVSVAYLSTGYWVTACCFFFFFFEYLASSGVAFSFFFSFFSFLDVAPTISLFLYMFLSLPMREDDLASNCVLQLMGSV